MKLFKILLIIICLSVFSLHKAEASTAVTIKTNMGVIVLRLDDKKAPITVKNFLEYVKSGHYKGTIFHRVIKGFMIQGGGMTADMSEKVTNAPIKNEASNGLDNDEYTIAMARTADPNSATAQFFINTVDNKMLNYTAPTPQGWGYAVFGKVIKGQDVVHKIESVAVGNRGFHENVPRQPVIIEDISIIK